MNTYQVNIVTTVLTSPGNNVWAKSLPKVFKFEVEAESEDQAREFVDKLLGERIPHKE